MKKPKIYTENNHKEYKRRMKLWVQIYGITHPALERMFLGTNTLKKSTFEGKFKPLDFNKLEL